MAPAGVILLEQPNLLRVVCGRSRPPHPPQAGGVEAEFDRVWMLETNLDDVPAEVIGYCFDQLFAAGAWTYLARRSR